MAGRFEWSDARKAALASALSALVVALAGLAGTREVKLVPLAIALPRPGFICGPRRIPSSVAMAEIEKLTGRPRPPAMVPPGTRNIALGRAVTASDDDPIVGALELVTDGDKEVGDGSYVELGPGRQHVQIDLGARRVVYAVVVWHYHGAPDVCRDVVVQVADDPDFVFGVKTLFNNDQDNSLGLGVGDDREYFETYEGKLVKVGDPKGVRTRYVRLYGNGSHSVDMSRYTEVEVYGLPPAWRRLIDWLARPPRSARGQLTPPGLKARGGRAAGRKRVRPARHLSPMQYRYSAPR